VPEAYHPPEEYWVVHLVGWQVCLDDYWHDKLWKFVEEFKQLNKPNMNIEVWDIYGARVVICLGAINFMYRTDPDTRYKERYHQQTLKNEAGFD
jgi:hypothetical protein